MTNAVAKVIPRRHKYIVTFTGEKRTILTTKKAKDLLAEINAIMAQDGQWLMENLDGNDYSKAPLYAVSIFEQKHSAEDLVMLRAWLKDALIGWEDGYKSREALITQIRREAGEAFADIF